jgi:formylglycine-generating enzyme required for sulfatase activity
MAEQPKRYRAFISYSQKDKAHARRVHKALESYRLPRGVDAEGVEAKTRKVGRCFRDDEEMGAATDLGAALQGAIADAENLIVVCSPHAAQSKWVNEEIIHFKRTGRADRIFAVIVAGEPTPSPGRQDRECFPPALRFELGPDGALTDRPAEPLGLDVRKEPFRRLVVRLAAGLIRTPFDALWKRELRHARVRAATTSLAVTLALLILAVAVTQDLWRPRLDVYFRYTRFAHSAAELMAMRPGSTFQDCRSDSTDCPVMVMIPEGTAMIGEAPDPDLLSIMRIALPLQQIDMPRFAVSQHEITWTDWQACVASQRCPELNQLGPKGDDRPVIGVSWYDAQGYAAWLAEMTGEDYRLLTEQEWEYAARGVTSAQAAPTFFSWGDEQPVCDAAAANGAAFIDCEGSTWPAGSFQPNAFGLYDMHGNVSEWTQTCWQADRFRRRLEQEATGEPEAECARRILRGGSWMAHAGGIRSARRDRSFPDLHTNELGFRVARTL